MDQDSQLQAGLLFLPHRILHNTINDGKHITSSESAYPPLTALSFQQPSLALAPSASTSNTIQVSHAASKDTLNAQGLHDTLSYGPRSIAAEVAPQHPLENRLKNVSSLASHSLRQLHICAGLRVSLAINDQRCVGRYKMQY